MGNAAATSQGTQAQRRAEQLLLQQIKGNCKDMFNESHMRVAKESVTSRLTLK